MHSVIILGAGLVGRPMALDLAAEAAFAVTVADRDADALAAFEGMPNIRVVEADLADPDTVGELAAAHDLVLGALPGAMGYAALEAVIAAERPVVDISFFPEDPFGLDALARRHGVTAVVDCGVFPGMGSALIGRSVRKLDVVDEIVTYVGGLPEVRRWPWEYRTVFSPADVIEEYVRPARYRENGAVVIKPALSDVELVDLPGVGTLEAFNTDGLRTLLQTIDAPNMREKTLRYPGHADKMALLRDSGFFSREPVDCGEVQIPPVALTSQLLFPPWEMSAEDGDLTVMRVAVAGRKGDQRLEYRYDLLDRYDPTTDVSSMSRTTGYTATLALRLVADGVYCEPGISPPEFLGRQPGCVDHLLVGLAARGVHYRETVEIAR